MSYYPFCAKPKSSSFRVEFAINIKLCHLVIKTNPSPLYFPYTGSVTPMSFADLPYPADGKRRKILNKFQKFVRSLARKTETSSTKRQSHKYKRNFKRGRMIAGRRRPRASHSSLSGNCSFLIIGFAQNLLSSLSSGLSLTLRKFSFINVAFDALHYFMGFHGFFFPRICLIRF